MADVKITALPQATELTGDEEFELVQGGVSKRAAASIFPVSKAIGTEILRNTLPLAQSQGVRFSGGHGEVTNPEHLAAIQSGKPFTLFWLGKVESILSVPQINLWGNSRGVASFPSNSLGFLTTSTFYNFILVTAAGVQTTLPPPGDSSLRAHSGGVDLLAVGIDPVAGTVDWIVNGKFVGQASFNPESYDWPSIAANLLLHSSRAGSSISSTEKVIGTTLQAGCLNYLPPAETTNGIPGWKERWESRQFVTSGDLVGAKEQLLDEESSNFEDGIGIWSPTFTAITSSDDQAKSGTKSLKVVTEPDILNVGPRLIGEETIALFGNAVDPLSVVEISFWIYVPSGQLPPVAVAVNKADSTLNVFPQTNVVQRDQWVEVKFVHTGGLRPGGGQKLVFRGATGEVVTTYYIDDFKIKLLGAVIDLQPSGVQNERGLWLDRSANKAHAQLSESGAKPLLPVSRWTQPRTTSTNGSVWIGGSDRMVLEDGHTFEQIYVTSAAGGETVQVGSTAGGSDIVASVALTAGLNVLTLARGNSPTNKISITSDSSNELEWSFKGGNLNF